MNLSGTFHLKLESRPASRNFPDSANLEDKKGTLRFTAASPFVCIHVEIVDGGNQNFCVNFNLRSVWRNTTEVSNEVTNWRVFDMLVYVYVYIDNDT